MQDNDSYPVCGEWSLDVADPVTGMSSERCGLRAVARIHGDRYRAEASPVCIRHASILDDGNRTVAYG